MSLITDSKVAVAPDDHGEPMEKATVCVLPGDGVGPEVTSASVRALTAAQEKFDLEIELQHRLVGAAALEEEGVAISDETFALCERSDAVLFGAVGSPVGAIAQARAERPEQALYRLRRGLDLYANLRPIRPVPELHGVSPVRSEMLAGTDLLFVRELSSGLYYGHIESTPEKPSEIREVDGEPMAIDTLTYTHGEISRTARLAFDLARSRRGRVTSVDKANVLASSVLWRRVLDEVADEHPDVTLEHQLVDACAMRLIMQPSAFDVVVTENLFGDILTDEASVLTGSLGMLPSASLGHKATSGGWFGLYEPVHGSAPDIAGQDLANPIGAMLSAAMLLRHSLGHDRAAQAIEEAVRLVVGGGHRTADIAEPGTKVIGTEEMGRLVSQSILDAPGEAARA